MHDLTYPKSANAVVCRIVDEACERRIIRNARALQPILEMTEAELYGRTREVPSAGWSHTQLVRLMAALSSAEAPDLAGRVLALMFPGLDVGFRGQFLGASREPSGNVFTDEARFLREFAGECEEIALAIDPADDTPGEVDLEEHDRIVEAGNRAQLALNAISAAVDRLTIRRAG